MLTIIGIPNPREGLSCKIEGEPFIYSETHGWLPAYKYKRNYSYAQMAYISIFPPTQSKLTINNQSNQSIFDPPDTLQSETENNPNPNENMSINVTQLETYIKTDLNVLIVGPAGTGKTAMLKEACQNLGLKMKYYNAATLDPFADLLGIPVPNEKTKRVEYYRPHDVDDAEVIFCDELNRASTQTTNAIFEMIQFRSINGEPLTNLRCVVAAMNPVSEEYDTEELDLALIDRFDVYLNSPPEVHPQYFIKKYGKEYAQAGIEIFNAYQKDYNDSRRSKDNKLGYLSPRRLDKLMDIFKKFPTPQTVSVVLPNDVLLNNKTIADAFQIALGLKAAPIAQNTSQDNYNYINNYLVMDKTSRRNGAKHGNKLASAYIWAQKENPALAKRISTQLAEDLNSGVGVETMEQYWKPIIKHFDSNELMTLMASWNYNKISQFNKLSRNW